MFISSASDARYDKRIRTPTATVTNDHRGPTLHTFTHTYSHPPSDAEIQDMVDRALNVRMSLLLV